MKILAILLIHTITSQNADESAFLACYDSFKKAKYNKTVKKCERIENKNKTIESMLFISKFFLEVDPERLNHILYNGMDHGYLSYEYIYNKALYTNAEKQVLASYFSQIKSYADSGDGFAQLLTAKIFYVNELIIKPHIEKISTSKTEENQETAKQVDYYPYLEKYLESSPNDIEALFLLGREGITSTSTLKNYTKRYYRIINQGYFELLLKSAEMGHISAADLIKGVQNWNEHFNELELSAELNNSDAVFELGFFQLEQSKVNPNLLDEAVKNFEIAGNAENQNALNQLLYIYTFKKPSKDKYVETLKKLIILNSTKAMLMMGMMGDFYLCQGQNGMAIKLYQKAENLGNYLAQYAIEDMKADGVPSAGCISFD